MQPASGTRSQRHPFRIPVWLGLCLFLAVALFFLWEEHQAHILGAVPYLLLMACPIIHLFMHRGHEQGHGGDAHDPYGKDDEDPGSHLHERGGTR